MTLFLPSTGPSAAEGASYYRARHLNYSSLASVDKMAFRLQPDPADRATSLAIVGTRACLLDDVSVPAGHRSPREIHWIDGADHV